MKVDVIPPSAPGLTITLREATGYGQAIASWVSLSEAETLVTQLIEAIAKAKALVR